MTLSKTIFLGAISSLVFFSCQGEAKNEVAIETAQPCLYNYDDSSTTVKWTAFKYTEKTGVSGVFEKVNVLISAPAEDIRSTLTGTSFTIPVESINSANEERDGKIQAHFFGTMTATNLISGLIKSINENVAVVELTMNGVSHDYEAAITIEGEKVGLTCTIDLVDFDATSSVDSLNAVCNDLHKGTDGISKLWTEVDINVETTLIKECP